MKYKTSVLTFLAATFSVAVHGQYYVTLTDNGPVVLGANITISATVLHGEGGQPSGTFVYTWKDDDVPSHYFTEETHSAQSQWNLSYPSAKHIPGIYHIELDVEIKTWPFWREYARQTTSINITDMLNGALCLHQNKTGEITNSFVSSKEPLIHEVKLGEADMNFLKNNATEVYTYWFIDCVPYGPSRDFKFNYNFTDVGKDHDIEALVIASFEKPVPTTTTTTPTPTTTSTTSVPPATNATAVTNTTTSNSSVVSTTPMTPTANASTTQSTPSNSSQILAPFVCLNTSVVPRDRSKTYGYFHKKISIRDPVENLTYTGTNWLQPGDILNLHVYCNGSSTFEYCAYRESQDYNVTGNETCLYPNQIENCSFPVTHFSTGNVTMIIIVSNDVSRGVLGVKINLYSAQKHPQLSVVIVPVTCIMIAVVLIVFGVAYYVQRQARFTVEIADFDFGQSDDLEYKTFRERLLDAVNSAVNRADVLDEENTGRKYETLP